MTSMPPPGGDPQAGTESWGYRAPGSDRDPPLDPLSRRLLQASGVLSVILVALVAYSFANGGEDTNLNPIAKAAERAERSPGMRIAIHGTVTSEAGSGPVSMEGRGVYNGRTGRSSLEMSATVPGRGTIRFDGVGAGDRYYTRSSAFSDLPQGKEWIGVEASGGGAGRAELGSSGDLHEQLTMLRAVSDHVEDLGGAEIRGVPTTAYFGTVDPSRYAALRREEGDAAGARLVERAAALSGGSDTEVTVWVDDHGLIRATRVVFPFPSIEGRPGSTVDTTSDFFDFGIAPRVRLPAPGKVLDTTAMGHAELGLLDGSTIHFPRPDPGAPPLSPGAYRARANGVCHQIEQEAKRRTERTKPAAEELHELRVSHGERAALEALPAYTLRYIDPELDWLHKAYGRFTRLPPPPSLAGQVDRLNQLAAIQFETLNAFSEASELEDLSLARKISLRRKALNRRSNQLARRIGLAECGNEAAGEDG